MRERDCEAGEERAASITYFLQPGGGALVGATRRCSDFLPQQGLHVSGHFHCDRLRCALLFRIAQCHRVVLSSLTKLSLSHQHNPRPGSEHFRPASDKQLADNWGSNIFSHLIGGAVDCQPLHPNFHLFSNTQEAAWSRSNR